MPSLALLSRPAYFISMVIANSLLAGCSGPDQDSNPPGNVGGDPGIGGNAATGGQSNARASAIGGAQPTGGASAVGGTSSIASSPQGGTATQGGSFNTTTAGGSSARVSTSSGGSSSTSTQPKNTGGSVATGGRTGTGGSGANAGGTSSSLTSTGGLPSAGGTTAAGGTSATGGTTSAGGASSPTCHPKFASGVNIAWFRFASDIPLQSTDIPKYTALFQNVKNSGGTAVRWWFHTNGTTTPGYDSSGKAKTISDANIADLKKILDAAHAQGVGLVVSLWSFGMLDSGQTSDATIRGYNKALLENDTNRQAYIDNVLTKMVTALKGYPGLFAWEIFNEPEGMSSEDGGWTNPSDGRTKTINLQKTVNWFTSAIKNADPSALVTSSANNFATLSPSKGKNLWSDSALTAAGGKANGVLDFYEVHYYNTWNGADAYSPFLHPVTYWGLDKSVVVGEFWTDTTDGIAAADLYTNLYSSSYSGAWAWQYANTDNPGPSSGASTIWPAMKAPMDKLNTAHPADLACQ